MMGSMMRRAMLGDGSTLSLDFTQMSTLSDLTSRGLTFSRSTSGTFINASGLVATATAGNPRFDYDPNTTPPQPLGLLIEGSANNLALNSNAMASGTYTAASGATKTATAGTAPDNSNDAARVTFTQQYSNLNQAISTTAGVTYTVSFWVKRESGNSNLSIYHVFSATGNSTAITVTTSWKRVSVAVLGRTGNGNIEFGIIDINTSGWGSVLVWGFQVETGSGASSLIPTGASTGSRAADSCVMTGTNFSSWYNATEGTLLAHAIRSRTNDIGRIVSLNDNTANESIDVAADTTGEFIVRDGGSALATISPGTVTANTAFKIAGAFKLNDVQAALGGTLGTADTSVTMPTVDRLMIGQQAGASPVYLNGTIALLKYWPTRLPNAQLQALTT
jgi:hypothetical protein